MRNKVVIASSIQKLEFGHLDFSVFHGVKVQDQNETLRFPEFDTGGLFELIVRRDRIQVL